MKPAKARSTVRLAGSQLAALVMCPASHAQAEEVDLELVLAMDASGSIISAGSAAAFAKLVETFQLSKDRTVDIGGGIETEFLFPGASWCGAPNFSRELKA